jgi:hypothetical protein
VKTVVLDVRSPADSMANFVQSWKTGKGQKVARISFAKPDFCGRSLQQSDGSCLRPCVVLVQCQSKKAAVALDGN